MVGRKFHIGRMLLIGLVLFFCLFMFIFWMNIRKVGVPQIRSDLEPIKTRFPLIDTIKAVTWKTDSFGDTVFGNNSYWLEGFIELADTPSNMESITDWELTNGLTPRYVSEVYCDDYIKWYHSTEFEQNYSQNSTLFTKFYYAPDVLVLYFYAETN